MSRRLMFILMVAIMALAACGEDTGDRRTDPEAAQSFFPQIAGYTAYETDNVQQAITTALGGAGVLTGNPLQAALIERVDSLLACYRERGAVDAKIYIEQLSNLDAVRVPIAGAMVVINQDRLQDNFFSCLASDPLEGVFAQGAAPEPCSGSGSFTFNNDTISYAYVASDTPLCTIFTTHFNTNFGG